MFKNILDFCFPNYTCLICGGELNAPKNPYFCDQCAGELVVNTEPLSLRGSKEKQYFNRAHAAFIYGGEAASLVMRLKYNSETDIAEALSPYMVAVAIHNKLATDKQKPDFIMPVPLSVKRLRKRGYNQALVLARELCVHLKTAGIEIPVAEDILTRTKATEVQKHMTIEERAKNIKGAFAIVSTTQTDALKGKRILLVDDVFTSGSTANECAKVLRAAGAARVDVLTIAAVVL